MILRPLPLLSIVIPTFNEEEVLPHFHDELTRVLLTLCESYAHEIIYVDDGSTDATPRLLTDFHHHDEQVRYVILSRNFGHQAALTAGLEAAQGDVVITMDADLQHPPTVIRALLAEYEQGHEVVLTIRQDHASLGWFKKVTSKLFYVAMRYCSGMDIRPAASDFRLLSRRALQALLAMPERHRFLRGMVHWLGFRRTEVTFVAPPRFAGRSKFTIVRMIRLARDGLLSFSRVPLHAALLLLAATIGVSFGLTTIGWLCARPEGPIGWFVLLAIVAAHAVASTLWVALVAFSEYLARIHEQVLARPLYIVQEASPAKAIAIARNRVAA